MLTFLSGRTGRVILILGLVFILVLVFAYKENRGSAETRFGTLYAQWGQVDKGEAGIVDSLEVRLDESEGALSEGCKILWESAKNRGALRQKTGARPKVAKNPFLSKGRRWLYNSGTSEKEGRKLSFVLVEHEVFIKGPKWATSFLSPEWVGQLEKAWVEGLPMDNVGDWLEQNVQEKVQYQIHVEIIPDKMMLKPGESETPTIFDQRADSWYWRLKKKWHYWPGFFEDYPCDYTEPSLPVSIELLRVLDEEDD